MKLAIWAQCKSFLFGLESFFSCGLILFYSAPESFFFAAVDRCGSLWTAVYILNRRNLFLFSFFFLVNSVPKKAILSHIKISPLVNFNITYLLHVRDV